MRDPKRIHDVIMTVEALWNKYPDWRFMQLINNLQRTYGNDMFYVEDDKFKKVIEVLTEMKFTGLKHVLTVSGKYDTISIFTDDMHYYVYNEHKNLIAEVYDSYEDAKEAAKFLAG